MSVVHRLRTYDIEVVSKLKSPQFLSFSPDLSTLYRGREELSQPPFFRHFSLSIVILRTLL